MITQTRLKELFRYRPETGLFYRLTSRGGFKVGTVAGSSHKDGYKHIYIDGKHYLCHRLAFLYMTGEMPEFVDHKDRDRSNNKWDNLREATQRTNCGNKKTNLDIVGVRRYTLDRHGYKYDYWQGTYAIKQKTYQKSFSIDKLGDELAHFAACEWRQLMELRHGT